MSGERVYLTPGGVGPAGQPGINANWRGIYNAATTYTAGPPPDGVRGSNGHWYVSLTNGNIGHDPTTDRGVNWADATPETEQPLFPGLMASLAMAQKNLNVLALTDSTGRDDTAVGAPTTGWVQRMATYLAALFPAYTVKYQICADDGAFGVTIAAPATLQTGTGGSPPTLTVTGAAIAGVNANFFLNDSRQSTLVRGLLPDAVAISFGHNSTSELVQWWWPYLALCELVLANSAGCELGLIAQNPEVSPSTFSTQQQARVSDVARIARIVGGTFVNVCQAFIDTGNPGAYTNTDGAHPSGGANGGQALWASVVNAALAKGLYVKRSGAQAISGLHRPASNKLLTNGEMTIDSGGNLTGWTPQNVTIAKDTTNFERTALGYAAKLTATAQNGFGAYVGQVLDVKQCKGRWLTARMRYYVPSGQAGDAFIGRIELSDGIKSANNSRTFVDQASRGSFSEAVVSLQIDPTSTAVEVDVWATGDTSANEPGSTITVQDVTVELGPEPRGLPAPNASASPLLAAMSYCPGTPATITTASTTLAALDTTNLTTPAFAAPTSGRVLVRLTGLYFGTSNGVWGVVDHGTANKRGNAVSITRGDALGTPASVAFLVTGLTPGTTYQFDWAAIAASTFNAGVGVGDNTGYNANQGPAAMEVWAA